jgi:hypothetical protein
MHIDCDARPTAVSHDRGSRPASHALRPAIRGAGCLPGAARDGGTPAREASDERGEIGTPRILVISRHNRGAAAGIGPDGARNTLDAGWPAALHP